ncbi:MAG: hypothetical protein O9327_19425 [Polaromonas sp.]|nr:hypothetical protein [Polaromonas sp.]
MNKLPTPAPESLPAAAADAQAQTPAATPPVRNKRMWALALGTAAVWHLDPALGEMAEMIGMIACAGNKTLAKDAITEMRSKADSLRAQIPPLPASALSKVVRRAEAACGAVLDKGVRMKEVQASWDQFLTCVRALQDTRK